MKKSIYIYFLLISVSQNVLSQKIIRQSLSCLGSSNFGNSILIQQTIGQSSNTTTYYHNTSCARQGFLQPLKITDNIDVQSLNIKLSVFPNPVDDNFIVAISGSDSSFVFKIIDVIGQTILSSSIIGNNQQIINTRRWNKGVFFISIYYRKNLLTTKKIIKTK